MGTSAGDCTGPPACAEREMQQKYLHFSEAFRSLVLRQIMLTWGRFGETQPFEPRTPTSLYFQVTKKPNEVKEGSTKSNIAA